MDLINEKVYQKYLESILNGKHVDYGIYGVSDITTNEFHAEIKSWKSWKNVMGQLISYNEASPRDELRAYMYGDLPIDKKLETIKSLLNKFNISVFHIEICQEVLIITNLKNMSSNEYSISSCKCAAKDDINIEEIKQIFEHCLTSKNNFCIDLKIISGWLDTRKGDLKYTLKKSYIENVDYIVTKKKITQGRGGSLHEEVLLTPQTFKLLCMQTKSPRGEIIRKYLCASQ
jgi:hypothetical protein